MTELFDQSIKRVDAELWLTVLEEEYLRDFIPSGGSIVRFVSGDSDVLDATCSKLGELANNLGLWRRFLDPIRPDANGRVASLHRIESLYKEVVVDHDWAGLIDQQLRTHLEMRGISVPSDGELTDLASLAQANDREVGDLAREVSRFGTELIRDPQMSGEFRLALAALGKERLLNDSGTPSLEHVILEWLAGRTVAGGSKLLKAVGIYDRIRATTARATFVSFMRWLKRCGTPGALVILDFRPYQLKKLTAKQKSDARDAALRDAIRAGASGEALERLLDEPIVDPTIYFSDKAFLQMLDLLRHFIDDVESFPGLALIVLTTDAFYDDASPRNYLMYNALQTRIGQEVRDAAHPNPVAMLSHLGGV